MFSIAVRAVVCKAVDKAVLGEGGGGGGGALRPPNIFLEKIYM